MRAGSVIPKSRSALSRVLTVALGLAVVSAAPEPRAAATAPPAHGVDLSAIDRSIAPGDDFFAYANGSWLKKTEIPADRATYGVGAAMTELAAQRTAALIRETAARRPTAGSEARKIADYYSSFMDEEGIEARGIKPLEPVLESVARIADPPALARALGGTLRADVDVLNNTQLHTSNLFGLWVAQDLDDPARYSPFLLQGGLGMPDREYYLDPSPRMADIRTKYQKHIAAALKLAGVADAEAKAARIFDLEHHIAETHVSRAESEDVAKGNNHWTRQDLATRAPGLDWTALFEAAGLGSQSVFVVWQPGAVAGISRLVAEEPLETWRDYLTFRAIERASPFLPKVFVAENFDFYGRVLTGTPKQRDRWKRAVDATNAALGEAVGKLYVRRFFPPSEKARVEEMVRNLFTAFSRRIDGLDWMTPETKARARTKLAALKVDVGYPEKWRDYSEFTVVRGDALGNAERAGIFEYRRNLKKLGRPVDRAEWVMTPQTVNAVNLPAMNALNFPAAILQPPLFDSRAPAASNYGSTGATIGHEISHSFDDQGALFDATGKLANWWTREDFAHFQSSAAALVQQYDRYRPFPDLAVNGKQTLSENIADVAGLAAAYDAYKISLGGKPAPVVGGLSGDQQFFLAFAQNWQTKIREPALRQRILTDGHAPAEYRADTVRNLDAWYEAFGIKPGRALYLAPSDRVRIW